MGLRDDFSFVTDEALETPDGARLIGWISCMLDLSKEKRAEDCQSRSYDAGAESENDRPAEQGAVGCRAMSHGQNSLAFCRVEDATSCCGRQTAGLGRGTIPASRPTHLRRPVWGGAGSQTGAVSRRPGLGGRSPKPAAASGTPGVPRFLGRKRASISRP